MTNYFSQKEFAVMRAEITGMAAVRWMALSGKPLTATEAKKLDETLEDFFRATGHRAFQEHGCEKQLSSTIGWRRSASSSALL